MTDSGPRRSLIGLFARDEGDEAILKELADAIEAAAAASAEGTDALPVDLSDYMAGYRQAQADLTGLDAAPAEEPTE